jgi:outer membrane protein assembly factor BamB
VHESQRRLAICAAFAAAVLSCKKAGAPQLGLTECIQQWPAAGGPHEVKAPLDAEAPKLLWAVDVGGTQCGVGGIASGDGGPVLSGDRIAFQAGTYVYFLNKDGTNPQRVSHTSFISCASGVAADAEGNVYSVLPEGVLSLNPSGGARWMGGGGRGSQSESAYYYPPVVAPDGVVYAATSDDRVYALRAKDGSAVWSKTVQGARMLGGAGNGLFVVANGRGVSVLDTAQGRSLGTLSVMVDGKASIFLAEWGGWLLGWDWGIVSGTNWVHDPCGTVRWSMYNNQTYYGGGGPLAVGELLVATMGERDGDTWASRGIAVFDASGAQVASAPSAKGIVAAIGADGTVYTVNCEGGTAQGGSPPAFPLRAYSPDLMEQWSFELGPDSCNMTGNVVLDEDGVLYLMRRSPNITGTQVMAIQTRSPGLADSSWPSWRHDNRGTAWLVPGVAASGDADVPEAQEAPDAAALPGGSR